MVLKVSIPALNHLNPCFVNIPIILFLWSPHIDDRFSTLIGEMFPEKRKQLFQSVKLYPTLLEHTARCFRLLVFLLHKQCVGLDSPAGKTPFMSALLSFLFQKVPLRNECASRQLDINKCSLAENMDQPSFLQVVDRWIKCTLQSHCESHTHRTP